ncbi:MAG TPA: TetR/AcrR family transcriptional regulator, partial [Mycobacterium sp.]|nr:TetR/AcrR family transcriptional regulator [Mycobacterium sp.]
GDRGYAETSMNQIADAAGVPVSGIYRYFPSKRDILATGLRVAADRVARELSAIMSIFAEPRQVLTRLIEAYVETSFANHDLSALYYTERVNLPPADQVLLRSVQRSMIDAWVQLLTSVRSELSAAQARVLVHAATGLVADLGRVARGSGAAGDEQLADRSAYLQACVRKLTECVLFGDDE